MPRTPITLVLNGTERSLFVESGENLLDALRRGIGDLSPKYGCAQGTCGTCSVQVDGRLQLACITLAETLSGRSITTAGGLAEGNELHPLQRSFMENFAAQCGYCTPGMLMAAKSLLDRNPHPRRQEVVEAISGNLCRCTGYEPIIDAILKAAEVMRRRTR